MMSQEVMEDKVEICLLSLVHLEEIVENLVVVVAEVILPEVMQLEAQAGLEAEATEETILELVDKELLILVEAEEVHPEGVMLEHPAVQEL